MKLSVAILFTIVPTMIFAQQKKLSNIDLYTAKAKNWFKREYVEDYFKDPYSYKLMKIALRPITFKQKVNSTIEDVMPKLRLLDTANSYSDYRAKLEDYKFYLNRELILGHDTSNAYYNQSLKEKKHAVETELNKYLSLKEIIGNAQQRLKTMKKIEQDKVIEYFVYLDCYGRNGYGNLVLNKYTFTLDLNGEGRDVKLLNDD